MKTSFALLLLIPSLSWGLTFKNGQMQDGEIPGKPFEVFFKENAGLDKDTILNIEEDIKENGNEWEGYNPRIDEIVNMFDAGIIDPTKVTRLALENAASVAGTLLITEAVVSKNKDEKDKAPAMDPSMLLG